MLNRFVCLMKKHIKTVYITSIILIVIIAFQNINIITPLAATSTITATSYPTSLNELSLNGSLIKLVIVGTGSNFKTTIIASDFVLNNAPVGLSISNVWLSNTDAFLQLSYTGTSFNNVITNLTVTALPSSNNKSENITSNNLTISPAIPLEGYLNYYATGLSYPTRVMISGYNIKNNILYLNTDLITTKAVSLTQKVAFYYYIDIFNGNGISIGNSGSYSSPNIITGVASQNIAAVINKQITLNSALTVAYRITVIITSVSIN